MKRDVYEVHVSEDNADTLIVSRALEFSLHGNVIVHSDVIVLLTYHWKETIGKHHDETNMENL